MRKNLYQITVAALSLLLFNNFFIDNREIYKNFEPASPVDPEFISVDSAWVDSVMNTLSLEEKIAQMIMVQAYSNLPETHTEEIVKIIQKHKIGGVVFFQGGPVRQALMNNRFQMESALPLLIAIDGEWGLGMRLDSVISYPRQMMLGAIQNNELIYQMGYDIASQMKELGIHMNFSPVADINNNPVNPVINSRSFGEDRYNVTDKVIACFKGMQDNGLLVTAKHFPGHGDTESDSHYTLPVIGHSRERLDSLELFPFREAIQKGLTGVMVAHLHVPALDERSNTATTVSELVVQELLINQMGFKGLVVTDALFMKGVSAFFKPGELEVQAVKAGNDILLMPHDVQKTIQAIKRAVRRGEISKERIEVSCRKILKAKQWAGLLQEKPIVIDSLTERLNSREFILLRIKLAEESLTLLSDSNHLIPLSGLEDRRVASVNFGKEVPDAFSETVDLYMQSDHFEISKTADLPSKVQLLQALRGYNTIIINIFDTSSYASRKYGITDQVVQFIRDLKVDADIILNIAGYPYCLNRFSDLSHIDAILVSHSEDDLNQTVAAQAIFGGVACRGRIPVSVEGKFPVGSGIDTKGGIRLGYTTPESVGMNYDTLLKIDSIALEAIRNKATPGCQVLVARRGKVIWNKAYGFHTYQNRVSVEPDHLYDIASITKIAATVPSLMRLRDQGRFHEDSLLKTYLPEADSSDKGDLLIKEILSHQSGLTSWIPFYYKTLEPLDSAESLISSKWTYTYSYRLGNHSYANRNVKYIDNIFQREFSNEYPIQVAKDLYLRADYRDTVYSTIYNSVLGERAYKYSDLGYYLLQKAIENITDTMLYPYTYYNFYAPLGAGSLGYLPLNRFPEDRIIPTENDIFFRKQLLIGYVHDPGAAMLGGIGGHAGLFSNANDLAKMMQMYLNWGWYGEKRYIDSTTLRTYTSCVYCEDENRRGLGFDRPITDELDAGPACNDASESSYGHSGFTGTIVWMDPDYDLLYIFLSNKPHPNQSNMKLLEENIRTNIQQVLYDAIEE